MSNLKDLNYNTDDLPITEDFDTHDSKPIYDPYQIVNKLIFGNADGFYYNSWFDYKVGVAFSSQTITYSFNEISIGSVDTYNEQGEIDTVGEQSVYQDLSNTQINDIKSLFDRWDDLIAAEFVFSANDADADIVINGYDDYDNSWGYAYIGSNELLDPEKDIYEKAPTSIWINHDNDTPSFGTDGNYDVLAFLHELGHALGLEHPGDYNAGVGVSITYDNNAEFYQDYYKTTIMSYFNDGNTNSPTTVSSEYPSTPMVYDILAIQLLYGAELTTRTDDNIYGATVANGGTEGFGDGIPYYSIWDAGGIDTLDYSRYDDDQLVNLLQGAYSNVAGYTGNVGIAFGTVIENAKTGGGDDGIIGNSADNIVDGGDGEDAFALNVNPEDVSFTKSASGDLVVKSDQSGTDTLKNIEFILIGSATPVYIIDESINISDFSFQEVTDNPDLIEVFLNGTSYITILKSSYILEMEMLQNGVDVSFQDLKTTNYYVNEAQSLTNFEVSNLSLAENTTNINIGQVTLANGANLDDYTLSVEFSQNIPDDFITPISSSDDFEIAQDNGLYYLRYIGTALDFEAFEGPNGGTGLEVKITGNNGSETITNYVTILITDANDAAEEVNGSIMQNIKQLQSDAELHVGSAFAGESYIKFSINDADRGESYTITASDNRFEVINHPIEGYILKLKDGEILTNDDESSLFITLTFTDSYGSQQNELIEVKNNSTNISITTPTIDIDSSLLINGNLVVEEYTLEDNLQVAAVLLPNLWTFDSAQSSITSTNTNVTFEFIQDNDGNWFIIAKADSIIDFESLTNGSFNVTANLVALDSSNTETTTSETFTVNVTDVNEAPALSLSASSYSIAENATSNDVLATVSATDADANDTKAYTVSDNRFEIIDESGSKVLKLKSDTTFDYETETSIEVTVTITDSGGLTDSETFTVNVTDVNDNVPEVTIEKTVTTINEGNVGSDDLLIATFAVSDKDTVGSLTTPTLEFRDEFGQTVTGLNNNYTFTERTTIDGTIYYDLKLKANAVISLNQINLLIITAIANDGTNNSNTDASSVIFNIAPDEQANQGASDFNTGTPGTNVVIDQQFIDVYSHVASEGRALVDLTVTDDDLSATNNWTVLVNGQENDMFSVVDGVIQYDGSGTSGSVYRISLSLQDGDSGEVIQHNYAVFLINGEQPQQTEETKVFTSGDDTFIFEGFSKTVDFDAGNDQIFSVYGTVDAKLGDGADTFIGVGSKVTIDGGNDNDKIIVLSGDNNLSGGAGNDIIISGMGTDTLDGEAGNDILAGDISTLPFFSDDRLIGGTGNDILMGGKGNDTFVFSTNDGTDTIGTFDALAAWANGSATTTGADFDVNQDTLEFNGFGFTNKSEILDHFAKSGNDAVFDKDGTSVTIILDSNGYDNFIDNVNLFWA